MSRLPLGEGTSLEYYVSILDFFPYTPEYRQALTLNGTFPIIMITFSNFSILFCMPLEAFLDVPTNLLMCPPNFASTLQTGLSITYIMHISVDIDGFDTWFYTIVTITSRQQSIVLRFIGVSTSFPLGY